MAWAPEEARFTEFIVTKAFFGAAVFFMMMTRLMYSIGSRETRNQNSRTI